MAGGYKLFSTGEVLTAANVNNYLMNQTVMVFASAAARTTALSGVLAEGMISYRSDAKVLEIYNGTSWITESAFVSPLTTKGDVHTYSTTDARLGVGTTNQTLIVDSTQTTGLKWAASPQSTLSAKGSLVSASAANTLAELAVGSDGQTLVANSAATTGLSYAGNYAAGKNKIINGDFGVWQRGTSVAIAGAGVGGFTSDRFAIYNRANQAMTISRQATNDTTNLPFIQYCARVQRNSGQTGVQNIYFGTPLDTATSVPLAGKSVTLSFYARKGADYSPTSSILLSDIMTGTGTDQNGITGGTYTGSVDNNQNNTLTTTWQRFTQTITVPVTATEITISFYWVPTGTAGTNDYFEITGVQLEASSVATAFQTATGTVQGELAACQRYYIRTTGNNSSALLGTLGFAKSTSLAVMPFALPVTMRAAVTAIDTGGTPQIADGNTGYSGGTWALDTSSSTGCTATYTHGSATLTQYRPYFPQASTSTSYIGFSAEL